MYYSEDDILSFTVMALSDHFGFSPGFPNDTAGISLLVTEDQFQIDEPADLTRGLVRLFVETYDALEDRPVFVSGLDPSHLNAQNRDPPVTAESLEENRITGVSWLMLFPPAMVERYGREWLLDAPVWNAEELDDGSVLLVATENPVETAYEQYEPLYEYFELEPPV